MQKDHIVHEDLALAADNIAMQKFMPAPNYVEYQYGWKQKFEKIVDE